MAQLVIEFEWFKDPKGYRLVETGWPMRVIRNGKGQSPKDLQRYRPFASTDRLFKIFANIVTTPKGVLDFVQRFGPLTWDGWDATKGDPVDLVFHHADRMRQILRDFAGPEKRRDWKPPYKLTPTSSLQAAVVWDIATKAPKWELRPNDLLDGLFLQLGQWMTGSGQIRHCEHCGEWFETGRGTGRRLDAKFCSDEHRIAFNSLQRSREK
jgi:hypothetical protein